MIIFLNRFANDGKSLQKWDRYKEIIQDKYIGRNYTLLTEFEGFQKRLYQELERGERVVVAAGGDGTVNILVNEIMKLEGGVRGRVILGAIGLGSSNDFHKPYAKANGLDGNIPLRLNEKVIVKQNVGQACFEDDAGLKRTKYFVINGSVGITAMANFLFNSEDRVIRNLKSKWVMGTIWYTALKTLLSAKNFPAELRVTTKKYAAEITSLNVCINPHVSGNLCFDLPVSPQSNFFGIALCEGMRIPARIRTFISLASGKFTGLPQTRTWLADSVEIYPASPTPFELDGEVYLARSIKIRLLTERIKVCL
jgi:diacylglycerol kinase (ATP)